MERPPSAPAEAAAGVSASASTSSTIRVVARSLGAGASAEVECPSDVTGIGVKLALRGLLGLHPSEQRLVSRHAILGNAEAVAPHVAEGVLELTVVRCMPIKVRRELCHPSVQISADEMSIAHSGGPPTERRFEAAFLSDPLDQEGDYVIEFRLSADAVSPAAGRNPDNPHEQIYVGLAPDENRDWSYLRGACLAFWATQLVLYSDEERLVPADWTGCNRIRAAQYPRWCFEGAADADGCTGSAPPGDEEEDERPVKKQLSVLMKVGMATGALEFQSASGEPIVATQLPLNDFPVRVAAMVAFPGQSVGVA